MSQNKTIIIFVFFISFLNSCDYWKRYNHNYQQSTEDLIKNKIAHFGDYNLNYDDVKLNSSGKYYIGYAKYNDNSYFVGYLNSSKKVKILKVFNNLWDKDFNINQNIILANDSLNKKGLDIDMIYGDQKNDSIGIVLVDLSKGFTNSNWEIKNISDIIHFEKYVLSKCFVDSCISF